MKKDKQKSHWMFKQEKKRKQAEKEYQDFQRMEKLHKRLFGRRT